MKIIPPYSYLTKRSSVLIICLYFALEGVLLLLLFYARGNALAFAKNPTQSTNTDDTGTTTSMVFLPSLQENSPYVYSLGTAQIVWGPTNTNGRIYYVLRVGCSRISRSIDAEIKVGEPLAAPVKGTIFFASGWDGTYYWAWDDKLSFESVKREFAQKGIPLEEVPPTNNFTIIDHLRADGYRTVQVKWLSNWWEAESGHPEGFANLACRPATVMQWVYDNLHQQKGSAPYCATGWSNGASQVAFALTHYGLSDILSSVVFVSGPNWSRVDVSCLWDHPDLSILNEPLNGRQIIDWGFGVLGGGTGPCARQDMNKHIQFASSSVTYGSNRQYFQKTALEFLFGELDTGTTALNGKYFYDYLVNWNNPIIHRTVVPGTDHGVTETDLGMQAMENTLRSSCVLR